MVHKSVDENVFWCDASTIGPYQIKQNFERHYRHWIDRVKFGSNRGASNLLSSSSGVMCGKIARRCHTYVRGSVRTREHTACNFVTKGRILIVMMLGQMIAERSSSLSSPDAESWQPQILRTSRGGYCCDTKADYTAYTLIWTENREARPTVW